MLGPAVSYFTAPAIGGACYKRTLGTRLGVLGSAIVAVIAFGLEWISGIAGRLAFQFSNDALVNATTSISLALPSESY